MYHFIYIEDDGCHISTYVHAWDGSDPVQNLKLS